MHLFSEDERTHWTHRLANLVLLNKAKNSAAQTFDFEIKKMQYFSAVFALTGEVMHETDWTPDVLQRRQQALLARLFNEWKLD